MRRSHEEMRWVWQKPEKQCRADRQLIRCLRRPRGPERVVGAFVERVQSVVDRPGPAHVLNRSSFQGATFLIKTSSTIWTSLWS